MANVLFSRTDSPSTKPITDGQIIFDTSGNGKMYLDNGTTRLEMGGAINVDATLDATSTNPIQNKGVAGVMLSELEEVRGVTKKGFLTDALATKTLDAKIGTTDISSIGDGTVTGAISDVNGKLMRMRNLAFTTDNMGEYIIGQKIIPIFMTTNNSEYYPKFEFYNYNNDIKVRVTNFSSAEYKIIPDVYFNCNLYYFDI